MDTGETSRSSESGYFPRWHPYYRRSVRMKVQAQEEIGPQLRRLGFPPEEVRKVVLTHLHTDHAGGLHHFPDAEILLSRREYSSAKGLLGRLQGYLPNRWPSWFEPVPIPFQADERGVFDGVSPLTESRDVWAVRTPGHTPAHLSVLVRGEDTDVFLAGDTSYSQEVLLRGIPDGVSPRPETTLDTMRRILRHASQHPTIYLPTHDPESVHRLERGEVLVPGHLEAVSVLESRSS